MSNFDQNKKQFKREVKYLNKDFGEFRRALINFSKNYFPNTYNDFNESDPGTMFIELASYVGDALSFYTDTQLRESLLASVEERINMYNLAQANGYKVKTLTPSSVDIDVYHIVPALGNGSEASPDMRYAQILEKGMIMSSPIIGSTDSVFFRTLEDVDFRASSSFSPLDVSVYSVLPDGNVEYYLLKKQVPASSGRVQTQTFTFEDPKPYDKIVLQEENVLEIIDVYDDDGNKWFETPYLAQDLVPMDIKNIPFNNPKLSAYRSSVPYLLCYKQIERRFVTRLRSDDRTEMQFGSGLSSEADEEIIPNPMNVGIGLHYFERTVDLSIDPSNFMYTRTYGTAPSDTTLTVRYTIGGGVRANVPANSINTIESSTFAPVIEVLDTDLLAVVQDSLAVNNPCPAYGGGSRKEIDQVRLEAMANFAAQNRAVTRDDYILRCYALPAKFGTVAKAYVVQDEQISTDNISNRIPNPFALNLYTLAYNNNRQFVAMNPALKENLRTYLKQHRMLTDAINIKDAFIINLGIDFEIIPRPNFNPNEVILKCVNRLIELFDNDKMEINQPIFLANIATELDKIEGVQTVDKLEFINLYDLDEGYSGNVYDLELATRNKIIYPSMDASIFEIKYPKRDIRGRTVDF